MDLWRQDRPGLLSIGGAGIVPVGGRVNHNVSPGAETFEIVKTSGRLYVVVRCEVGVHRVRAGKLARQTFADGDVTIDPSAGGIDTINIASHGYETGDGPLRLSNSGGALPTGLAIDTDYWIVKVDDDNFALAASMGDALRIKLTADPPASDAVTVQITAAAGGGTHEIGGNQGAGNQVGFDDPVDPPAADVVDGTGSWPLIPNETVLFAGRVLTVRATSVGDVLSWYEV